MTEPRHAEVDRLDAPACELGESALWDDRHRRLYWVDILGRAVFAHDWDSGALHRLRTPETVGCVALRERGGLIAAMRHGLAELDVTAGALRATAIVEAERPGNRFNDGAVDPYGRFWFGSMDLAEREPTGTLFRLDGDGTVTPVLNGIVCSNGPAFSLDGRTLYHADSARQRITAYEVDPDSGALGPGRLFASDSDQQWFPDGMTVDAEGFVWSCKWDGWRIVRYAPDGSVDRVLRVPVPRPTRCAFAGPELDVLAVTTARRGDGNGDGDGGRDLSGRVLLLDPGVRGVPAARWSG
jgi:sugar lactone lactonase YvrE